MHKDKGTACGFHSAELPTLKTKALSGGRPPNDRSEDMKSPKTKKAILLMARLLVEEHPEFSPEDIYLNAYQQAVKDMEQAEKQRLRDEAKQQSLQLVTENPDNYSFEYFWKIYEKKLDKDSALKAWNRLSESEKAAAVEYAPRYVAVTSGDNYRLRRYPATYLNKKTWTTPIEEYERIYSTGVATTATTANSNTDRDFFASKSSLIARLNAQRGGNNR